MKVTMLGTGTSFPDPERVQSGILVELENDSILFDIGPGTYYRMIQLGLDLKTISSIFITHFHVDHCSDLVMLCQNLWLAGHDKELNVYGPSTIMTWWRGIFDVAYPYARDRLPIKPCILEEDTVVKIGEAKISNVRTCHSTIETHALRLEAGNKVIVYSSDTALCNEVIDLASGVDLLIHECNWLDGPHPEGVHTSPSELAEVVEKAQPKRVILTHVNPEVVENRETVVNIVRGNSDAEVLLGQDLMSLDL